MDCFARGLRNAVKIIEDGFFDRHVKVFLFIFQDHFVRLNNSACFFQFLGLLYQFYVMYCDVIFHYQIVFCFCFKLCSFILHLILKTAQYIDAIQGALLMVVMSELYPNDTLFFS